MDSATKKADMLGITKSVDKTAITQDARTSEPKLVNVTDKILPELAMKNEGDICDIDLKVKILKKPKSGGAYMLQIEEMEYTDETAEGMDGEMKKNAMMQAMKKGEDKYTRLKWEPYPGA